ncbi:BamA/TamA family outer membrane protein [Persephonella sp.]
MPVFILIFLQVLTLYAFTFSFEIKSNYPLPNNNIEEVYEKTGDINLVLDLLKRTRDFEDIYFHEGTLYLKRKPYLKKVKISGNYSFWKKEIMAVSGFVEGFTVDRSSIHNILIRLKQFYIDRGYPYAKIDVHFSIDSKGNGILNIHIDEGEHYEIGKVKIFSRTEISENISKSLEDILDLEGKEFSINNIQEKIDRLEEFLSKKGFYDALINILSFRPLEKGKIQLNILVDIGYRYKVEFEGNRFFPTEELKKVLTFSKEGVNFYQIGVSAENIEKLYREYGFLEIKVVPQLEDNVNKRESTVRFIIDEGKRYLIEDIDLETDIAEIKDKIERFIGTPYKEGDIEKFLTKIIEKYYKNGYLDYDLKLDEIVDKNNKTVYLKITARKGKLFVLSDIEIRGIEWKKKIETPSPYDPEKLIQMMEDIKKYLEEKGYMDAKVELDTQLEFEKGTVYVKGLIDVTKGLPYENKVTFLYGTKHLNISAVKRNLTKNKIFTEYDFDNELDFLYKTYLFSSISPYYNVNKKEKYVTKAFIFREEKRGLFQGILGYNSDQKLKIATSVILKNLFSYGFETSAYVERSDIRTNYSISFGSRIFPKRVSGFLTFFKSYQYHKIYDIDEEGYSVRVERRNNKWVKNSIVIEKKYNKLEDQDIYEGKKFNTLKIEYGLTDDHRSPRLNPTSGYIFNLRFTKEFLDVEYYRIITSFRYYKSLWFLILTQKGSFGYITKNLYSLPPSERFFLGGLANFRGFAYEEVAGELKQGGKSMILINNDIRFPIFKPFNLYGFIFLDLGNVYENDRVLRKFYLRKTSGVGIYIPTPVGSFILDFAYKLDKKAGEYPYRTEFSIAIQF